MYESNNEVRLKGRVTKDIELRGDADKVFCFFTLACDRPNSNASDFVDCRAFGELAKSCAATLKKGSLVRLKGKIASGSYEKDKQKIYTQTVVAEDIALINRSSDQGVSAAVRVVNESDLGEAEN